MDLIHWYLYCQLFSIGCLVNSKHVQQPQISQTKISNDVLRLECSVPESNKRALVMHFYCVNKDRRCFENCKQFTAYELKINCTEKLENDKFSIFYDIYKPSMPSGTYYCQYGPLSSSFLKYTQEKLPTTTTVSIGLTPIYIYPIRFEFMMLLLGMLGFSVILNVAFLVRCCIVRSYLNKYPHLAHRSKTYSKWSWVTCFCLKEEMEATNIYYKTKDDPYEKIRERPSSETSKSKSSITNEYLNRPLSQDTEKLCLSSSTSQISRSSTFPARQSILVHTPTDQFSLSAIPVNQTDNFHSFMIQYALDPQTKTMKPLINQNPRISSLSIYNDVAEENVTMNSSSTMPIRHFASTSSLQGKPRQNTNSNLIGLPLPEESQINFQLYNKHTPISDEDRGLIMNDCSSTLRDFSSSEEIYVTGKDSDTAHDQVRVAKLEMSREMMAKADTLLREAHNLLKMS